MTALRSAADILHDFRVSTPSSAPGRYYATCPECSHKRKQSNQKLKCLGVTIDERGVQFGCNHCGLTGAPFMKAALGPIGIEAFDRSNVLIRRLSKR
jgi:hypothetical protein